MKHPPIDISVLERILEYAPGFFVYFDTGCHIRYLNRAAPPYTVDDLIGEHYAQYSPPEQSALLQSALDAARDSGQEQSAEYFVNLPGDRRQWHLTQVAAVRDDAGEHVGFVNISTDITRQKEAEQELEKLQADLLEASHRAGMAEVATGVLHNVGNVLNSVNVSIASLMEQVGASRLGTLSRAIELCEDQGEDLPGFIADDPRGSKLPALLSQLGEQLLAEHEAMRAEVERLVEQVNIMRSTVDAQQLVATSKRVLDEVDPEELIDRALSMFRIDFDTKSIELVTDVQSCEHVLVDKQSVLQILVNLIRNAIEALLDTEGPRVLEVKTSSDRDSVLFEIIDNGCGIDQDHLAKIFRHGFTTKPRGHGFGLHSSAIAAGLMGGSLEATSDGPGRGARFCLSLPKRSPG